MFLRHFFQEKMQEGNFIFIFLLPFANRNDVPTISGAWSQEQVHQNSTNQQTNHTH